MFTTLSSSNPPLPRASLLRHWPTCLLCPAAATPFLLCPFLFSFASPVSVLPSSAPPRLSLVALLCFCVRWSHVLPHPSAASAIVTVFEWVIRPALSRLYKIADVIAQSLGLFGK